jgi:hypothetical protein
LLEGQLQPFDIAELLQLQAIQPDGSVATSG